MARTASGRLRLSRSLLPRTSRFQASKRAPRKPSSSRLNAWIMVPMAPSSTRMRSAASRRSVVSVGDFFDMDATMDLRALLLRRGAGADTGRAARPQPEQVADGVDEIGAVHGVEMKVGDAVIHQVEHLFGGDGGGEQLAGCGIVVEAVEAVGKPGRHRGAAARGKSLRGLEILHRQNPGHDWNIDACRAHPVEVAEV